MPLKKKCSIPRKKRTSDVISCHIEKVINAFTCLLAISLFYTFPFSPVILGAYM